MPPKRKPNKNKEKLEKQRNKLAKAEKDRKEKMDKLMEQMAATREKAERDLRRWKYENKMELQIEMDKKKKDNKKFNDLKVASTIASALNKKDKDDDDFAADAIALLQ